MAIVFDEKNHRYTNTQTGENYISVTTLLSNYKPKFDIESQAARFAAKEGLLVEDVKQYWADLNRISTTRGTAIHAILEEFLKTGEENKDYNILIDYFKGQLKEHSQFDIIAEERMYNDIHKIAGTADIIFENKDYFKIWDLKTNKKFRFTNYFKSDTFLLSPVDHLVNCEYSNYCLQLSMYAYMKEQLTGKKCIELKIVYFNSDPDAATNEVKEYYLPYLKSEILEILEQKKNK
jgi:hypothetical protein